MISEQVEKLKSKNKECISCLTELRLRHIISERQLNSSLFLGQGTIQQSLQNFHSLKILANANKGLSKWLKKRLAALQYQRKTCEEELKKQIDLFQNKARNRVYSEIYLWRAVRALQVIEGHIAAIMPLLSAQHQSSNIVSQSHREQQLKIQRNSSSSPDTRLQRSNSSRLNESEQRKFQDLLLSMSKVVQTHRDKNEQRIKNRFDNLSIEAEGKKL